MFIFIITVIIFQIWLYNMRDDKSGGNYFLVILTSMVFFLFFIINRSLGLFPLIISIFNFITWFKIYGSIQNKNYQQNQEEEKSEREKKRKEFKEEQRREENKRLITERKKREIELIAMNKVFEYEKNN